MSLATLDSLIPASSNSFSNRWISRPRSRVIAVRAPGQVPQLADRGGWHERAADRGGWDERAADQTMCAELGQPGRIGDITLAAGQVLHLTRLTSINSNPAFSSR
jgi:hypothetical protein